MRTEWCGGAALMAKLWSCGWNCAGFAMCAAWVGLTFGLDMSKSAQIRGLVGEIEVTGVRILLSEVRVHQECPCLQYHGKWLSVLRLPNKAFTLSSNLGSKTVGEIRYSSSKFQ